MTKIVIVRFENLSTTSSLHLWIERSQIRLFGHISRIPQERLPKQAVNANVNGKRPIGQLRTRWLVYIEGLCWYHLGLCPSEIQFVLVDDKCDDLILNCCSCNCLGKAGEEKKCVNCFFQTKLTTNFANSKCVFVSVTMQNKICQNCYLLKYADVSRSLAKKALLVGFKCCVAMHKTSV